MVCASGTIFIINNNNNLYTYWVLHVARDAMNTLICLLFFTLMSSFSPNIERVTQKRCLLFIQRKQLKFVLSVTNKFFNVELCVEKIDMEERTKGKRGIGLLSYTSSSACLSKNILVKIVYNNLIH